MNRATPLFLVLAMLAACQSPDALSYKLYPGPVRPDSEIAIVSLGDQYNVRIDGMTMSRADWTDVHLSPGAHTISWETRFAVSVMVNPSGWDTSVRNVTVDLEPGHVYKLKSGRTTGPGYEMFLWIEDLTTGAVVAGVPKP